MILTVVGPLPLTGANGFIPSYTHLPSRNYWSENHIYNLQRLGNVMVVVPPISILLKKKQRRELVLFEVAKQVSSKLPCLLIYLMEARVFSTHHLSGG